MTPAAHGSLLDGIAVHLVSIRVDEPDRELRWTRVQHREPVIRLREQHLRDGPRREIRMARFRCVGWGTTWMTVPDRGLRAYAASGNTRRATKGRQSPGLPRSTRLSR